MSEFRVGMPSPNFQKLFQIMVDTMIKYELTYIKLFEEIVGDIKSDFLRAQVKRLIKERRARTDQANKDLWAAIVQDQHEISQSKLDRIVAILNEPSENVIKEN